MKKKLVIGGLAVLLLGLLGGATFWLNHAGYIHLWKTHGAAGDSHAEAATGIDVTAKLRKLFEHQDMAAQGNADALAGQEELTAEISGVFHEFKPADWRDPKNVNAVMAYVLSGGDTEAVEKFLKSHTATDAQQSLAKGVLSFALGRPKTALKQIGGIDPRAMDSPVVGPMSLALATLHANDDTSRSLALYDDARLHAPGTAVEEAALRRQFPLLLKSETPERATMLLTRYVRVFGKSLYAPAFFKMSATGIAELDEARAVAMVEALGEALGDESDDKKYGLFLDIAQSAVMSGRVKLATTAANVVKNMPSIADMDRNKAKFYAALAAAPTEAAATALGELDGLPANEMEPADAAIQSAAKMVARSIVNASAFNPGAEQKKPAQNSAAKPRDIAPSAAGGVGAIVNRADAAIKQADQILATGAP